MIVYTASPSTVNFLFPSVKQENASYYLAANIMLEMFIKAKNKEEVPTNFYCPAFLLSNNASDNISGILNSVSTSYELNDTDTEGAQKTFAFRYGISPVSVTHLSSYLLNGISFDNATRYTIKAPTPIEEGYLTINFSTFGNIPCLINLRLLSRFAASNTNGTKHISPRVIGSTFISVIDKVTSVTDSSVISSIS